MKFFFTLVLTFVSAMMVAQDKGKPEKQYTIHDRSNKVSRVDVRKDLKKTENVIQFDATNASGGANMATRAQAFAPANISAATIISGSYNQTREIARTSRGMSLQLLDVVYPCRVRVAISDQFVDIEIKQPGFWKVAVALTN